MFIPILFKNANQKKPTFRMEEISTDLFPFQLAHFDIKGYWVFKCTNGKTGKSDPQLYGIPVDNSTFQGRAHSPYDAAFGQSFNNITMQYEKRLANKEIDYYYVGRPYDGKAATGQLQDELEDRTSNSVMKYLKFAIGNAGDDLTIVNDK